MRIESSVTSVSWIPREAIDGLPSRPFGIGATHYDLPPPDVLEDVDALNRDGAYRFANRLVGWIESDGERITDYGQGGRGYMSVTKVKLGITGITFPPVAYPDLRPPPEAGESAVRFVQNGWGPNHAAPPRIVEHRRFIRIAAPPAWTTVALTLHADSSVERGLTGTSPFPLSGPRGRVELAVRKTALYVHVGRTTQTPGGSSWIEGPDTDPLRPSRRGGRLVLGSSWIEGPDTDPLRPSRRGAPIGDQAAVCAARRKSSS